MNMMHSRYTNNGPNDVYRLSRIEEVKSYVASEAVFDGMQREFLGDNPQNQTLVLQVRV